MHHKLALMERIRVNEEGRDGTLASDGMIIYPDTAERRGKSARGCTQGFFGIVAGWSRKADVIFPKWDFSHLRVTGKNGKVKQTFLRLSSKKA